MKKNTGYREMLRDRLPKVVNYALKYVKCKERWLDHVYRNWIWIYSDNDMRNKATRRLLGLDKKGKPTKFVFEDTILWDNLSKEEEKYWKDVSKWVSWFCDKHMYIQDSYDKLVSSGKDIIEIKQYIMRNYLLPLCPTTEDSDEVKAEKTVIVNDLCDYLIDTFENRI